MSDFERDARIEAVFSGVADAVADHVNPRGVAMVYATVRRRRRNQALAGGTLVLALLAGSATYALAGLPGHNPPAGNHPTTSEPTPSDTPSPTPAATPAAPDGRITLKQLGNATLELPVWPAIPYGPSSVCAAGKVKFRNGTATTQPDRVALVGQPVYSDVDHDGAQESAIIIRCSPQYSDYKVLVFDRTDAGKIYTVGEVVGTVGLVDGEQGKDILKIWAIRAEEGGQIGVDVGEYAPCCGTPTDLPQHQWRTYGWNGKRFTQTGGPAVFGPNPHVTDIQASASSRLVMTQQTSGTWRGALKITIKNAGPNASAATLVFTPTFDVTVAGVGCGPADASEGEPAHKEWRCEPGRVTVGKSKTVTVTVTSTAEPAGKITIYGSASSPQIYRDPIYENNTVSVRVTTG